MSEVVKPEVSILNTLAPQRLSLLSPSIPSMMIDFYRIMLPSLYAHITPSAIFERLITR
jgi:hypothetical protein